MLDLLEEKSSLIPMVVGEVTEVVLSPEKILPKSIDLLLMPLDGSPNLSFQMDSVKDAKYKLLTVSVLLILFQYMFNLTELLLKDILTMIYKT